MGPLFDDEDPKTRGRKEISGKVYFVAFAVCVVLLVLALALLR